MATEWTPSELMAIRAAKELKNREVVFVGIGLPNLACNFARATHAPELFMIYESGAVGTIPSRVPPSIGDPTLVTDSLSIVSQADIFQLYLQGGLIEVGFLGGAQVDRYGNINTTVIGSYQSPKVRLPGSGGACEIAIHSQRLLIMMTMTPKSFVAKCDFITSPGHRYFGNPNSPQSGKSRQQFGHPGRGPMRVITQVCLCDFVGEEMVVTELFPGVTREQVRAQCGWEIRFADSLKAVEAPDLKSISALRGMDPGKLFLK